MHAPHQPPQPPTRKRRRRRSLLLSFLGFGFGALVVGFLAASAVAGFLLWKVSKDLPGYESLAKYEPPVMTRIHAQDGALISEYARERRIFVPINTVPKRVIAAFLSAEDRRFYEHGGVDFQGIARAVFKAVESKVEGRTRRAEGASTITQQVAKNFLLSSDRTIERKVKEAILAIRIERAYSKDRILELYLNEIYLGMGAYGVAAAAMNYFNKELSDLTVEEAAYLAALPKGPNNYHPFRQTKAAIARRNWIIGQMAENGYITSAEAETAKKKPLGINIRPNGAHIFAAEYFAEEVRRTPGLTLKPTSFYGEQWLLFTDQWDAKSVWADRRIRLAVNHAIDRQAINQSVTLGFSKMTGSIIPQDFEFSWPAPLYSYDLRKAKQLLTEAGYPHGFEAGELWTDANFVDQSEAIANYLGAAGVRTRVRTLERAAYLTQVREKKLRPLVYIATATYGNAATRIDAFVAAGGTFTYGSYPDIEGLIQEQAGERDRKRREATLHRIQQLMHERTMFVPIWNIASLNAYGPRVAESGFGLIGSYLFCAPYEDVRLKSR